MNNKPDIVCFGEVLWDVFPTKRLLGGAPLNVAMRLHSLGADTTMISSVGNDDLGKKALALISESGLSTDSINILKNIPTGTVFVVLTDGSATYTIDEGVAWDSISVSELTINKVAAADALVFGSLALRNEFNRTILNTLIDRSRYTIFDLNLRKPYFSETQIIELMNHADLVKMNDEELEFVCKALKIDSEEITIQLKEVSLLTNTRTICITLGGDGAMLLHNDVIYQQKGYPISVADTVGAGDSFLAGLICELLSNSPPEKALATACALGAIVASKHGANCIVSKDELQNIL